MFNQTTKLSSNHGYQPHFSGQSQAKTLAGAQESQVQTQGAMTLDQWMGLAKVWFDKANGKIPLEKGETMPTQAEYAQMTEYWNWATGQSNPGWDPNSASEPQVVDGEAVDGGNPSGGMPGPMRNIVYNAEKARIAFTGNSQINDIWSDDVIIDVAPLSASVTSEITKDTRFNPAEDVLKVTVKDPATGTESVYMIHDYKDAKIKVNTPKETQLKSKAPSVTWGHFQEGGAAANAETEAVGAQNELGEWEYEAADTNEFLEFRPQGGDNQTNVVLGNTRIITKLSDHVNVTKNADGTFTVIVTHKDKSTDTYKIQKGFRLDLQANPEYVSFGSSPEGDAMPGDFAERVSLNRDIAEESPESEKKNPQPDAVQASLSAGDLARAVYNTKEDVELFAMSDSRFGTFEIHAPGTVAIHVSNYSDQVTVKKYANGSTPAYIVTVVNAKTGKTETYMLYAAPEKLVIDGVNIKWEGGADSDPVIEAPGKPEASPENDPLERLKNLLGGKSDAQIVNALKAYFPEIDSIETLKAKIAEGSFPPKDPTKALVQFLSAVDLEFYAELNKLSAADPNVHGPAYEAATNRLVKLLEALYPDHNISAAKPGTTSGYSDWRELNDFLFDAKRYSYTEESEGQASEIGGDLA